MRVFGQTDIGKVRQENQDAWRFYMSEDGAECAVAVGDGMGGARAGSVASGIGAEAFISHVRSCLELTERSAPDEIVRDAAAFANLRIYDRAFGDPDCRGMGTTLVGVLVLGSAAAVVNVGDSRAYCLAADGTLSRVTRDHSLVEEMVDKGRLTPEEARRHPRRNIITRALGMEPEVRCDIFLLTSEPGERLLLCTDGLSNQVQESEIARILGESDRPEDSCRKLVELALERGAPDNVTAAVLCL